MYVELGLNLAMYVELGLNLAVYNTNVPYFNSNFAVVHFFIAKLIFCNIGPNILETLPKDCITRFYNVARNLINTAASIQETATGLYNI
ncbi:hypothetical protein TSAR_013952 [Trichomalopsis sarcophagae]|uniref:Uncharacterized protein n=1 Tax=Trichomalopsis sarcophagae TaxID=543379 RepID=A0A232FBL1_9HYME|nr:hypothetical protein TSAR_013952 [Trichomalopsis sarcophagae]